MNRLISIIVVLFIAASSASGQTLNYEVVKGSKKLGKMIVERQSYNNEIKYNINSKVVFRILFSFTVDFECSALYKDDILQWESTTNRLNGSIQKASSLEKEYEDYVLTINEIESPVEGPITYSIAAIYFNEPEDGQKVYSPQFAQYLTFLKIDDHVYKMESPDGKNVYTYLNGICTEVKVSRDFAKFYFRMASDTYYAVKTKADSIFPSN